MEESCHDDKNEASKDIIKHIVATISDRAATEVKFNDMLQLYRKEVLLLIYSQFDEFNDEEKLSLSSLSNFFCGLHALVNFAETTEAAIKGEHGIFYITGPIFDKKFEKDKEPGHAV